MSRLNKTRTAIVVLLLALGSLDVFAQQQPAPRNEKAATPTGVITGRVVDERGQPIANAVVSIRAVGASGQAQIEVTDREGAFQANGLDRASYIVSAQMPSYTVPPRDPSVTPATTYRVGDSVTLTLIKGGVVTGTVTNSNSDPVVAVTVRVQMIRDANGRRVPNGFTTERPTDDRGIYRIYGLPAGTYVAVAGGPGYHSISVNVFDMDVPTYAPSSGRDTAAEISVRSGEETTGVDIRYRGETGRVVSGQVNPGQDPNVGYDVTLTAIGDAVAPSVSQAFQRADTRGFVFTGVADGDYYLLAYSYFANGERPLSMPKRITVKGADVTGIDLIAKPLGSVSGRVVFEESKAPECADKAHPPFNEMLISAWHNDNEAAKQMPPFVWNFGPPVPPDADGNFNLKNLAPGQYYFITRFVARYWYLQSITFTPTPVAGAKTTPKPTDATHVWTNVKLGERLSGLTVTLAQGGASLRGRISLGEGEQLPERLFVYLAPSERERADELLRFYAVPVTPDGKITLNSVAPGRYWILPQVYGDEPVSPLVKLRLPHETETRAKLRREAEAAKTEIEFKPCQTITDYQLPLKP
jgi:carboxypeptidase family protein